MPVRICSLVSALILAAVANATEVRIMPLGDSLTATVRYQPVLRQRLTAAGVRSVLVGSQTTGNERHEGHPGWNTAQIAAKVTGWIDAARPDVVLLQIGTNDMYHGFSITGTQARLYPHAGDVALAPLLAPAHNGSWLDGLGRAIGNASYGQQLRTRASGLIDAILDHPRRPRLVVARIPPVGAGNPAHRNATDSCTERIREFNAHLATVVAARRSAGAAVAIVDNFTGVKRAHGAVPADSDFGDAAAQSTDWVHPASGADAWRRMGENFATGTRAVLAMSAVAAGTGSQPRSTSDSSAAPGSASGASDAGGGKRGCGGGSLSGLGLLLLALQAGLLGARSGQRRAR